jgi:hypothetical protein
VESDQLTHSLSKLLAVTHQVCIIHNSNLCLSTLKIIGSLGTLGLFSTRIKSMPKTKIYFNLWLLHVLYFSSCFSLCSYGIFIQAILLESTLLVVLKISFIRMGNLSWATEPLHQNVSYSGSQR